jgi:hypothetical protein
MRIGQQLADIRDSFCISSDELRIGSEIYTIILRLDVF